ncbi:MAG: hypothetical protein R3B84_17360 [Zavarzinella sp.]
MSKMPKQPEAMKRSGRPIVADFHPEEYLYRRVPTRIWPAKDSILDIAAIELPDISTARSEFGHPEWLRLDYVNQRVFKKWGIIGVQIKNIIPASCLDNGKVFTYRVSHVPLEVDYPHSEIQAFDGEQHLNTSEAVLPEELHLEWRANLLEVFETFIPPGEDWAIREEPPGSHVPETHPDDSRKS